MNKSSLLFKVFVGILAISFLGGGTWYLRYIYFYESWFDKHLLATIWTEPKKEEVAKILNQPFFYFAKGSTSKAYVSADGQFVLKMFLKTEFKSKGAKIPVFGSFASKRKELRVKYNRIFGPINAYQNIPKESGLIYYQFIRPTCRFSNLVALKEQDGSMTSLDLNQSEFLLQQKAIIVSDYLLSQVRQANLEKAKKGLVKLLEMTKSLYEQGIVLFCLQFIDNFGFVADEPIRIDVEHLCFEPNWKKKGRPHIRKELSEFRLWIEKNTPELTSTFNETIQKIEPGIL